MHKFSYSISLMRIADVVDKIILVGLFIWLCIRILPEEFPPKELYTSMILLSEGVVLVFVLFRRSTDKISLSIRDWFVALAGTMTVLLVGKGGEPLFPITGTALVFIGFMIHFGAKLSLRRSFGIVPADRGIKSDGLYRYVRHPMYFGYFVSHMGFLLAAPSAWNLMIYSLTWMFLVARINCEERLLLENPEYRDYREKVRYRLIPKMF